jgi:hypothetical protein
MRDEHTRNILGLKWRDTDAVAFFYRKLDPLLARDFVIAVVPSHTPANQSSGIRDVARRLARNGRIDGTACLVRHRAIEKLSQGGSRSARLHNETISVANAKYIQDREILLLDDVMTTGNSLQACKDILCTSGARQVHGLALGRTARGVNGYVSNPSATAHQLMLDIPPHTRDASAHGVPEFPDFDWLPRAMVILGMLVVVVLCIIILLMFPGIILVAAGVFAWRWLRSRRQ